MSYHFLVMFASVALVACSEDEKHRNAIIETVIEGNNKYYFGLYGQGSSEKEVKGT